MSNIPNFRREELHAVGLLIFVQLNDSGAGDFRRLAHVLDMQFLNPWKSSTYHITFDLFNPRISTFSEVDMKLPNGE